MAAWVAGWMRGEKMGGEPNKGKGSQALVRSARQGHYAVRALPNEDIALWVKSIDNSRVVLQRDPQVRHTLWRFIGGSVAAAALVLGLLLPGAYGWLAGYQVNALEKTRKQLLEQRELLKLEQARAESPKQLEQWAAEHGMKAPGGNRVVYLRPANDRSLAMAAETAAPNR